MQDFQFGLVFESNFFKTPQETLKDCKTDFTSIFGTFNDKVIKDIPIVQKFENDDTPFSKNAMMENVFSDSAKQMKTFEADDDEIFSSIEFEC